MDKVKVLFTCVGGAFIPATIQCLRETNDVDVKVFGVDQKETVEIAPFLEGFKSVDTHLDCPSLGEELLDVCKRFEIDIVFPGSERDCQAILNSREHFTSEGIFVPMANDPIAGQVLNKKSFYCLTKELGLNTFDFFVTRDLNSIVASVKELGYPMRAVVVKPCESSGSRGTFILTSSPPIPDVLDNSRRYAICNLEKFHELVESWSLDLNGSEFIVMPFFGGTAYDVDCLSLNHNPIFIAPRMRLYKNPLSPVNQGCKIHNNPKLLALINALIHELNLNFVSDFDVAFDEYGNPQVIDAALRFSGSISASSKAGLNIPSILIKHYLGLPISNISLNESLILKPFQAFYSFEGSGDYVDS